MCCQHVVSHAMSCELSQMTYNLHVGVVTWCHCMIFCMVCCLHAAVKKQFTRLG